MGNSSSNSTAMVGIATEKELYTAGEEIRGYVQLTVHGHTSGSSIGVRLHGEVHTKVHYRETEHYTDHNGDRKTRTHHRTAYGHDEVLRSEVDVAIFPDQNVGPGLYQFPFVFVLPPDAPASHSSEGARLHYSLAVLFRRPGMFKWDLWNESYISVRSSPPPLQPIMRTADKTVNCCCCCSQGSMHLGAKLGRDGYCGGDKIMLCYECANNSSRDMSCLGASLHCKIHRSARGHHDSQSFDITAQRFPAIEPGGGIGEGTALPAIVGEIPLPGIRHSSLHTRLLSVRYELVLEAKMKDALVSNVNVKVPVTIFSPPVMSYVTVQENGGPQHVQALIPYAPNMQQPCQFAVNQFGQTAGPALHVNQQINQQSGFQSTSGSQQPSYPPQQPQYPSQQPQQQYPPQQPPQYPGGGYPPPQSQGQYVPPPQGGYAPVPQPQGGYAPQPQGSQGYAPPPQGYPSQQGYVPPPQQGYAPAPAPQPGYAPQPQQPGNFQFQDQAGYNYNPAAPGKQL